MWHVKGCLWFFYYKFNRIQRVQIVWMQPFSSQLSHEYASFFVLSLSDGLQNYIIIVSVKIYHNFSCRRLWTPFTKRQMAIHALSRIKIRSFLHITELFIIGCDRVLPFIHVAWTLLAIGSCAVASVAVSSYCTWFLLRMEQLLLHCDKISTVFKLPLMSY